MAVCGVKFVLRNATSITLASAFILLLPDSICYNYLISTFIQYRNDEKKTKDITQTQEESYLLLLLMIHTT